MILPYVFYNVEINQWLDQYLYQLSTVSSEIFECRLFHNFFYFQFISEFLNLQMGALVVNKALSNSFLAKTLNSRDNSLPLGLLDRVNQHLLLPVLLKLSWFVQLLSVILLSSSVVYHHPLAVNQPNKKYLNVSVNTCI